MFDKRYRLQVEGEGGLSVFCAASLKRLNSLLKSGLLFY
jgi:hypothetical protein